MERVMGKLLKYVFGIAAIGCLMSGVNAYADDNIKIKAKLSSAQEAIIVGPGLIESAEITADFEKDLSAVEVTLTIKGGANVVAAHFHCGRAGTNGPVVFGLFSPGPLTFDGSEAKGTLTNADFTGANCTGIVGGPVSNIAALALAMRDGLIYTNVHTTDNPGGEVRGQMFE
jgi:hypothetical protein